MEERQWINHVDDNSGAGNLLFGTIDEADDEPAGVSINFVLPDDLLERILAFLPVASIFRAGSVCKRWHEIVTSDQFLCNSPLVEPQKPWYYISSSDEAIGYAYDPILRKWYDIDLPCIMASNWFISSSCGLVCFMDNDKPDELFVCNPIIKCRRGLARPPGPKFSDYSALAFSVDRVSCSYNVMVVKSKQVPGDFFQWELSIHLYGSVMEAWVTVLTEVLTGWRGGEESVICDGVLCFLVYSTGGGASDSSHGLLMYDIKEPSLDGQLFRSFIPAPCLLTCGRLMNLKERLVMVGGIRKHHRQDVIKGIGIWVLEGREWKELARMPPKYFQGFGELDDVFASSGNNDLVYIQSYGSPALLIFDVNLKQWRWSHKCPIVKKFPLQLFSGFCFEPRLDTSP